MGLCACCQPRGVRQCSTFVPSLMQSSSVLLSLTCSTMFFAFVLFWEGAFKMAPKLSAEVMLCFLRQACEMPYGENTLDSLWSA